MPLPRTVDRRISQSEVAAFEQSVRDHLAVECEVAAVERRLRANHRIVAAALREEFSVVDEFLPQVGSSLTKQTQLAAWLNWLHGMDQQAVQWFR
jgi:hypothetical protein